MRAQKLIVASLLGCLAFLVLSGCFPPPVADTRTGNQGGSSAIQAGAKLGANHLDWFNPDDVQVLADLATEASGAQLPEVTDEQAAAFVTFIADNNIVTIEHVQALVEQAQSDPDSIVISDEVQAVLEAMAGDLGVSLSPGGDG